MSEPFFDYIKNNRETVSNKLYGYDDSPKKYPKGNYIQLKGVEDTQILLTDALQQRRTTRDFSTDVLPLETLSSLLKMSIGKNDQNKGFMGYSFPSGGAFYPIESYILINNVSNLEEGIYHYSATEHSLALIQKTNNSVESINKLFSMEFKIVPQAIMLMTMVKSRCIQKYGSLSYKLSLIEAGHRGQNISLCVNAFDIGCCSMGSTNYDKLNTLLGVDGVNEHYIYSIALGIPLKN